MAKRFRFQLDPVLRQRKRLEEERLRAFASAQREVLEQSRYLDGLAHEKEEHQREITALYAQHSDFQQILDFHRYVNTIDIRNAYGARELRRREAAMEKERATLLEARKNRRAIEILKERREKEHRQETEREEAKTLDELSIQSLRARRAEREDG